MVVKYNNPEAAKKISFKLLTLVINLTLTIIYTIRIAMGDGYLLIYILIGLFLIISGYTFFEILEDLKGKR